MKECVYFLMKNKLYSLQRLKVLCQIDLSHERYCLTIHNAIALTVIKVGFV